jgi:hypothetical protein
MLRLIQSLLPKIFTGDLVQFGVNPTTYTVGKIVKNNVGTFCEVIYGKHKQCSEIKVLAMGKKQYKNTFIHEWRLFTGRELPPPPKPDTLEQLCIDRNIKYLYDDLIQSRTIDEFKTNTEIIYRMLNTPVARNTKIEFDHGVRTF